MFPIKFGVWVIENWVFGLKNGVKIVTAYAKSYPDFAKSYSNYLRMKMLILTQKIVLRFFKSYSNLTASANFKFFNFESLSVQNWLLV